MGTSAGFITPALVAHFTKDSNTLQDWTYIFVIGAVAYILPSAIFALFGSGEIQKWNEEPAKLTEHVTAAAAVADPEVAQTYPETRS